MSVGVLLFAYNNEHFDYLKMAEWSMHNIHRHLDLPVCVVTDSDDTDKYNFDIVIKEESGDPASRYFVDINDSVKWFNGNRSSAYDITPFDTTLVLDVDYVVASKTLLRLVDTRQDFLAHRYAYDAIYQKPFTSLNQFGKYDMPLWWATVMAFRRSQTSEMIFDMMKMVRKHWDHYNLVYEFDRKTFRNDYALSVTMNAMSHASGIPWNLATVIPNYRLSQIEKDSYEVEFDTSDKKTRRTKIFEMDFHAMGKKDLGDIVANPK